MADTPGDGWDPNTDLCGRWGTYSTAVQQYAIRVATRVLWSATGRRFGLTPVSTRPRISRQWPLYETFPVGYFGYGFWTLVGVDGGSGLEVVGACGCGSSGPYCRCGPTDLQLPDYVSSVTSVTIEGTVLDPSAYTLAGGYLTRTDGSTWPTCQDFATPLGGTNTWVVAYQQGEPVPDEVNDAAGLYACQVGAAVAGGSCMLPNRVKSMTRQGINMDFIDTTNYLSTGLTGYDAVDSVIVTFNPAGLRAPVRIFSPDRPQFRS